MTPSWIARLLASDWLASLGAVLLTSAFWWSGCAKLLHFGEAQAEVAGLGLPAPPLVAALTIVVQLCGSLAIILRRGAWFGAGALGLFTALATVVAHGFWRFEGIERAHQFNTFLEHIGLIGGFLLAAILIDARRPLP